MSTLSTLLGSLGIKGFCVGGGAGFDKRIVVTDGDGLIDASLLANAGAGVALTKTYFIDDVNGSDSSGSGSAGRPLKTMAAAAAANAAGTASAMVMILAPGTYAAPTITEADQNVVVILGLSSLLCTITGNLTFNNAGVGDNVFVLSGVTADVVRDITETSTFYVYMRDCVVTTASYSYGDSTVHGSVYMSPDSTLTNVPATRLDVVYDSGPWRSGIVPDGTQDGANTAFELPDADRESYVAGSLIVYLNGLAYSPAEVTEDSDFEFTISDVLPDAGDSDTFFVSYQLQKVRG